STGNTYAYQWQTCSTSACASTTNVGSGASSYTPVAADQTRWLRVQVTASQTGFTSASAFSTAALVGAGTFAVNSTPSVSGTAKVGQVLTATSGSWSPSPSTSPYQWQVSADGSTGWSNATGTGATTSSYTVVAADLGQYLRIHVVASKTAYTDSPQDSAATAQVVAGTFSPVTAPAISGS